MIKAVEGPDGNLWFTEVSSNQVGKLNPTTGAITEFGGLSGGHPQGITEGPDNNIWFVEGIGDPSASSPSGFVGWINPTAINPTTPTISGEVKLPSAGQNNYTWPLGITAGPNNTLWFTEFRGNGIGKIDLNNIDPKTGLPTVTEFGGLAQPAGAPSSVQGGPTSGPSEITLGPDGNLWFTELFGNQIGMLDPTTGAVTDTLYPTPGAGPYGITVGPDHNLWFTESDANEIGEGIFKVVNTPPTVTVTGPSDCLYGQKLTFQVGAMDTDSFDETAGFTYTINWDDGSPLQTIPASSGNGSGVSVDHLFLRTGNCAVTITAQDKDGALGSFAHPVQVDALTNASLQAAIDQVNSTRTIELTAVNSNYPRDLVTVLNNLGSQSTAVTFEVDLGVQSYAGLTASLPSEVTLLLQWDYPPRGIDPYQDYYNIKGALEQGNVSKLDGAGSSPALTVIAGNVIAQNIIFTTGAPTATILVSGDGHVTLEGCVVQESTGSVQAAVSVTDNGTAELSTSPEPFTVPNTLNINGDGRILDNSTANDISSTETPSTTTVHPCQLLRGQQNTFPQCRIRISQNAGS
jgi:hypothetical protein